MNVAAGARLGPYELDELKQRVAAGVVKQP